MDEIVCLGWGSLIWCQKALPLNGVWQPDGPSLPIEFARESVDKRITLVVCEGCPPVTTLWAQLAVKDIAAAKTVLAAREGVTSEYPIGWWNPAAASTHPGAEAVGDWAAGRNFAGVVWTALQPKFGNRYRKPTRDQVIQHLQDLTGVEPATFSLGS